MGKMQQSDKAGTHHVPGKIGQPVDSWVYSTDKLQMLGFVHPLLDQEEDEAGRDEGHGKDNADGHHNVSGGCGPVIEEDTAQRKVDWRAIRVRTERKFNIAVNIKLYKQPD